jgi:Domain of unknown function (DUF4234)
LAETVRVGSGQAKIRNLWIVALLLIVTLGIYYFFWYYLIKREMRDFGAAHDRTLASISPGMGVLAMTIGWWIIVPPFVSAWRTVRHVRLAEQLGGIQPQHAINHTLGFLLFIVGFVFFPVEVFYLQLHLNRLWRHGRDEQEKQQLGMRGYAPANVNGG